MRDLEETIRKHGWAATAVTDHDPPFMYSAGLLSTYDHPELIVFGLPQPEQLHGVLARMVDLLSAHGPFATGEVRDDVLMEPFRVLIREVHPSQHVFFLGYAMGHARVAAKDLRALQVVLPDASGVLPTEPGCDPEWAATQPHLGIEVRQEEVDAFLARWGSNW